MPSGFHVCLGDVSTLEPCRLSRKYKGQPVRLSGAGRCSNCAEMRCKSHCKCARKHLLKGRNRGRPSAGTKVQRPSVSHGHSGTSCVPARLAHADADEPVRVFHSGGEDWVKAAARDLNRATDVSVCVFMYDDPDVHASLMKRVRQNPDVNMEIIVDGKQLQKGGCYYMRPRLRELQRHGVAVYLAPGRTSSGHMHCKNLVMSSASAQVAFTGSSNFTKSARAHNHEMMLRVSGLPVRSIRAVNDRCRATAVLAGPL